MITWPSRHSGSAKSSVSHCSTWTSPAARFGLRGIPRVTNLPIVIVVVIVTYVVLLSLVRSRIGRALIAIREDEVAAAAMGIETTRMKVTAFPSRPFSPASPGRCSLFGFAI